MTPRSPVPPRLARVLARLRPLGGRRSDAEADLAELFRERVAAHGVRYACRRYWRDVLSLWVRGVGTQPDARPTASRDTGFMRGVTRDVKFAVRLFRRQSGVVSVALVGLGVAIGVSTPVFSIANAFNFRALGVDNPEAVVHVDRTLDVNGVRQRGWTFSDYLRMSEVATLIRLEASVPGEVAVSATPEAVAGPPVTVRFVTGRFAGTFGGRTRLGRAPGPADDAPGAGAVATLHYAFWRDRLNGDPAIVGRTMYFNGAPVTVVGVFDRSFTGPFEATRSPPDAELSLASASTVLSDTGPFGPGSTAGVEVIGRLQPGATAAQAEAEANALARGLGWGPTAGTRDAGVRLRPAGNQFTADDLQMSVIAGTIVGLIVLLAASNVANLLLAGAVSRQQEIGARLALGASRSRIVRQLVTESLLLGLLAGATGLAVALWITPLVAALFYIPPASDLAPDFRLIAFVTLVSVLAGVAAGLAPARFGARTDFAAVLKSGAPQSSAAPLARRLRSVFLGIQAAASVMLLVLTALFTRALLQASQSGDLPVDRLVTISAFPSQAGAHVPNTTFWNAALDRVRTVPGVEKAGLARYPPLQSTSATTVMLNGVPHRVLPNQVSPEYFDIVGARFVAGRPHTLSEAAAGDPVAVITEGLAKAFWPKGDALGSTLDRVHDLYRDLRVIGIVTDTALPPARASSVGRSGVIFRPVLEPDDVQMVVLLTEEGSGSLDALRSAVAVDSGRRSRLSLVRDELERRLAGPRVMAVVAATLGGLAVVLAVIGIVGVAFLLVGQRRRELGVRLAIGATSSDIMRIVLRDGLWPVVIGLVCGIGLAWMGTQVISSYLVGGVNARDPLAFTLAIAVLLASAAIGLLVPARRAARLDPVAVLREP